MRIGILALQGAFAEHGAQLGRLGVDTVPVRLPNQLDGLDGLILPGGESTAIGKLAQRFELMEPIRRFAEGRPILGTCAGMILMAKRTGSHQPLLGILDVAVERNGFGRQIDSFESPVFVEGLPGDDRSPFPAIFIRAPLFSDVWGTARVIARLPDGTPVAVRQGHLLATAFHPELSNDSRLHRFFLALCMA